MFDVLALTDTEEERYVGRDAKTRDDGTRDPDGSPRLSASNAAQL